MCAQTRTRAAEQLPIGAAPGMAGSSEQCTTPGRYEEESSAPLVRSDPPMPSSLRLTLADTVSGDEPIQHIRCAVCKIYSASHSCGSCGCPICVKCKRLKRKCTPYACVHCSYKCVDCSRTLTRLFSHSIEVYKCSKCKGYCCKDCTVKEWDEHRQSYTKLGLVAQTPGFAQLCAPCRSDIWHDAQSCILL